MIWKITGPILILLLVVAAILLYRNRKEMDAMSPFIEVTTIHSSGPSSLGAKKETMNVKAAAGTKFTLKNEFTKANYDFTVTAIGADTVTVVQSGVSSTTIPFGSQLNSSTGAHMLYDIRSMATIKITKDPTYLDAGMLDASASWTLVLK